jgi:tetratricopeptide (TPR) repeat protein
LAAVLPLTFLLHAGCEPNDAATDADSRVVLPGAAINGRPIRAILDTGSSFATFLNEKEAQRLGLRFQPTPLKATTAPVEGLFDQARLTIGSENVTAQFAATSFPGMELALGWPAVRDNRLDFNGAARTLRVLAEVPVETAGWLKLKLSAKGGGRLFLEFPLADGTTGTIMVDTGDPDGVALPSAPWKQWRADHPQAPLALVDKLGVLGSWTVAESHAEKIALGPLTFTDVPVRNFGDGEAGDDDAEAGSAGIIGLGALERMEMVVDGKNSVAYLHPYPSAGAGAAKASPGLADGTGDWAVVGQMRLKGAAFALDAAGFKFITEDYDGAIADFTQAVATDPKNADAFDSRGNAEVGKGDRDGAMADYTHALELDPANADACAGRGFLKAQQGDFAGALADCNRAIELAPDASSSHESRAVVRQIQGDAAGALADYGRALELNAAEPNYLRLYSRMFQLGQGPAPAGFAKSVDAWKEGWSKTLGQFVAGQLDETALLAGAEESDKEPATGQKCEACYFAGMMRLLKGDRPGARDWFQKALATNARNYYEYAFARAELARLDAPGHK